MGIDKTIRERRTIHSYKCEEVPSDLIEQALELATFAPNHRLTFPFLFIHAGPRARKKIADIAVELKGGKEVLRKKFESEGSLIFFAQRISDDETIRKEDYATMACAIQNYSLYLWEKGYGTKWSSGKIIRSAQVYKVLELDANEYEIVGMVWAGGFSSSPKTPERPKLKSVMKAVL